MSCVVSAMHPLIAHSCMQGTPIASYEKWVRRSRLQSRALSAHLGDLLGGAALPPIKGRKLSNGDVWREAAGPLVDVQPRCCKVLPHMQCQALQLVVRRHV